MEVASIYGFGSFFSNKYDFNDIDILILHKNVSYHSCQFSLLCKKYFISTIHKADITILSESGERQFNFIKKSNAILLGIAREVSVTTDIDTIINNKLNPKLLAKMT